MLTDAQYVVNNHSWRGAALLQERDVVDGPELAPGGLVVVRGLCEAGSHADAWYGPETGRAWNHSAGASDPAITPPSAVFTGEQAFLRGEGTCPPSQLLGALRTINRRTGAAVSLFCAHTWGGDLAYVFAWVFDGKWNNDRVYLHVAEGPGRRVHAWSQLRAERPRVIVGGDVLTLVLVHHGVLIRDGYFEPHTRSFPWDRYRV